jgi:hypothetical protein
VTDDQTFHDAIEGYCGHLSYRPGEVVELHVSTRAARFDVTVERWGASRQQRWSAFGVPGQWTPPPADADADGCRWPVSVEIPVGADWEPGFHLVTVRATGVAPDRAVSHACFVVRGAQAPGQRSGPLLVLDTNTWNAYNTWGGCSLYTGGHRVSFDRPFARGMLCRPQVERDDRKARPVHRRENPDVDGAIFQRYRTDRAYPSAIGSAGWFTHARRFVEWAERAGYQVDLAVSTDLDHETDALTGYELVLSVGHDEYWSAPQREVVETYVAGGGHFASFSGNTMFWQVRHEGTSMVCHKYRAHLDDPVVADGRSHEATGLWADPLVGRPEWSFLGAGSAFGLYHRFGQATPRGVGGFIVYRPGHWLMERTGLTYGDVLGADDGVVGYETVGCPITFDEYQLPLPWPRDDLPSELEIVGLVPSSNLGIGQYPASIAALSDQGDLEFLAVRLHGDTSEDSLARVRHGNAVMATCRPFAGGGEVTTIGTTDWVFGLAHDPAVARVTANVLDRYTPAGDGDHLDG